MKKFLALILALTLVASLCAVNVMAASKVHTLGITASKTEALVAGETVVVEVTIDNTLNLVNVDYDLLYDKDAFEVSLTKVSRLEEFIDKAWNDDIKNADGDWGYYMNGAPTINGTEAGAIYFRAAGGANGGVEAEYAVNNRVIGKYNIKVKADATDGTYEFKVVNGKTGDFGENETAAMAPVAVTVTVGEAAPAVTAPTFDATTAGATDGVAIKDTDKKFDNAFAVSATIKPGSATEVGMLFVPEAVNNWEAAAVATYGGKVAGEGTVTFTAAIKNIPRAFQGKDLVMLSKAYAKVGDVVSYGNEVKTTINFGSTGEVE